MSSHPRLLISSLAALAVLIMFVPASASALCFGQAPTISGTAAGETIPGTSGDDVIEAGGGNDIVNGGGGNDRICGEGDDDTINGQGGNDQLDGGANATLGDTVTYLGSEVGSSGVTANLQNGTASIFMSQTDTLAGFENLTGTNGFDNLTGNGSDNVIRGLDRADSYEALGGNDTLIDDVGGASDQDSARYTTAAAGGILGNLAAGTVVGDALGTDTLTGFREIVGSAFADVLIGNDEDQIANATDNSLIGMGGSDLLEPRRGTDFVLGGDGTDRVTYANDDPVQIDLSNDGFPNATTATGVDSVSGVENVTGSSGADTITGDANSNVLDGLLGADELNGGGGGVDTATFASVGLSVDANLATGAAIGQGSDTLTNIDNLTGSTEGDFLTGDANANVLSGGPDGVDVVRFNGVAQAVTASLLTGTATGQGTDTLDDIESLTGSDLDDTLTGDDLPNTLSGRDGADSITGGLGADFLFLGAGADVIAANDGVVDTIDCEGGGPDSGSVDGPAPAETYLTDCDTDGDAVVDFLDACPTQSGATTSGCPLVVTPPPTQPPPAAAVATGQRAAALKRCKKIKSKPKRRKCRKRALKLPV